LSREELAAIHDRVDATVQQMIEQTREQEARLFAQTRAQEEQLNRYQAAMSRQFNDVISPPTPAWLQKAGGSAILGVVSMLVLLLWLLAGR
jgi:hypothetical protein